MCSIFFQKKDVNSTGWKWIWLKFEEISHDFKHLQKVTRELIVKYKHNTGLPVGEPHGGGRPNTYTDEEH